MRQLRIQVPRGCGRKVLEIARSYDGMNLVQFEATGGDAPPDPIDVVMVSVANGKVEGMLDALETLPELHVTLTPRGVMPLRPPPSEAPKQVIDVEERSPIEVLLSALQSIGSWKGFLGYAVAAGFVVWIGLFTNTIYLLIAAMLIAPFAGPAMNAAIATARGDQQLLMRSLLRYFAALGVTIGVTALLSLILRQEVATQQMIDISKVSSVAVLLPLVAGAAGALNLLQSERDSLVSGAAVGMLVAASLAPPAGLVGMASAIGEWEMAVSGLFVLLLQLVGINLSGAIIFRIYGLSAQGARYKRGRWWMFPVVMGITLMALAGLLFWQFSNSPDLQRSSRAQRAIAEVQGVVNGSGLAQLVEANVRFTRGDIEDQNTLLGVIYVQRRLESKVPVEEIRSHLTRQIQTQLLNQGFNVTPLITVTVLEPPS